MKGFYLDIVAGCVGSFVLLPFILFLRKGRERQLVGGSTYLRLTKQKR